MAALALLVFAAGAQSTDTVTYYYTDAQGTVLAKADAIGNVINKPEYRPYGVQVQGTAEDGPGYTGHVNDVDSGLIYMQARYYDPAVGRLVSIDPVEPSPGDTFNFNRYDYTSNNPINHIDPTGEADYYQFPNKVEVVIQRYDNKSQFSNAQIEAQASKFNGLTSSGKNMIVLFRPGTDSEAVKMTTNPNLSDAPGSNNRSHTDQINGRNVQIAPDAVGAITIGHEAGHTMGSGDQYKNGIDANGKTVSSDVPGAKGAIMRDYGGKSATQQSRDEIENNATKPGNHVFHCSSMQGTSCK